ncbi:hypothetical protein GHK92_16135 [Nocardioides sp. dk4132]|uniref:hypothetical protein n=1 Tax=unclassified Nocardioides TaxID=2615069 RepID=UPI001298164A|nr:MULTISPECIES: hypothetical protein [unclassified Nocardioides]MQW77404.1 hypothetical protein [Nocardioides sp. dk4132]QGA09214.1 hypothetical protein GFH29_18825 [Nocardioides sp. dk884]
MKIYVAGPLTDIAAVQAVQAAVMAAGHELALDWTQGLDATFVEDYGSDLALSASLAADDLEAVLTADAVLVVMSDEEGKGMFVELGAALARAHRGELQHVVLLGPIRQESVFYFHPAVQRMTAVDEWLASIA